MSCPPALLDQVNEYTQRVASGRKTSQITYSFEGCTPSELIYCSTTENLLKSLSKKGRAALGRAVKDNLGIMDTDMENIKSYWETLPEFVDLAQQLEESYPSDFNLPPPALPSPVPESEANAALALEGTAAPAPRKSLNKKIKRKFKAVAAAQGLGDAGGSAASEPEKKKLKKGTKKPRGKSTGPPSGSPSSPPGVAGSGVIIDVEATESAPATSTADVPAAPVFRVTGNASSSFSGSGTIVGNLPELFNFLVAAKEPKNITLENAVEAELDGSKQPFSAAALAMQSWNCVNQGLSPIHAISLATCSVLGLLHKANVKPVKPTAAVSYTIKMNKILQTLWCRKSGRLTKTWNGIAVDCLDSHWKEPSDDFQKFWILLQAIGSGLKFLSRFEERWPKDCCHQVVQSGLPLCSALCHFDRRSIFQHAPSLC